MILDLMEWLVDLSGRACSSSCTDVKYTSTKTGPFDKQPHFPIQQLLSQKPLTNDKAADPNIDQGSCRGPCINPISIETRLLPARPIGGLSLLIRRGTALFFV